MANEEHLKILKQGVEVWNQWRAEHPEERPDLGGANLERANLERANLERADLERENLRGANLTEANLGRVNLRKTDLEGADLVMVNLVRADLTEANLGRANLGRADLTEANLGKTNLERAYLGGANLGKTNLMEAYLGGANLVRVNLWGANLEGANLGETNLGGAYLGRANLRRANLGGAYLGKADLRQTDLRGTYFVGAQLIMTNFGGADITGAKLYGTARNDWIIDGVICDYVFWDVEGKQRTPKDRDFRPGEFEELYKSLPTFEYYFDQGFNLMNIYVMDQVVQAINERHQEFELTLKNFEITGTPHATLTVLHKEHVEAAKTQLTTDYESRIAALEGKQEQLMEIVSTLINQPQQIGDVIIGNKMITAGQDYFEHMQGNVDIQQAGGDIVQGDKVGGDKIEATVGDVSGGSQVTIGKEIQQTTPPPLNPYNQKELTEDHRAQIKLAIELCNGKLNRAAKLLQEAGYKKGASRGRLRCLFGLTKTKDAVDAELSEWYAQTYPHKVPMLDEKHDKVTSQKEEALERQERNQKVSRHTFRRFTDIRFPEQCKILQPVILTVQLKIEPVIPEEDIPPDIPKPQEPLEIDITPTIEETKKGKIEIVVMISTDSFEIVDKRWQKMEIPFDSDSEKIAFILVGQELGQQLVEVEFFHSTDRVGYVVIETQVVKDVTSDSQAAQVTYETLDTEKLYSQIV